MEREVSTRHSPGPESVRGAGWVIEAVFPGIITGRSSAARAVSVPKAKDQGIETLRGLAIILMVAGHVIGSSAQGGMQVADDSLWRYLYLTLSPMRMPLFTVISGFVYAYRPVRYEQAKSFLAGKGRRLLLPMISVATVQYVFSCIGPGVSREYQLQDIWRIYLFSYDQFWFLQAIALVFLCVFAIELIGGLRSITGWLFWMAVAVTLYVAGPDTNFFSIDGWCALLVFFLLGVGLNRFDLLSSNHWVEMVAVIMLVASLACHQAVLLADFNLATALPWVVLGCGLAATLLLVRQRVTWPPLAWLGQYAFTIYLLHCFGVVAARIVMKLALGVTNPPLTFTVGLIAGLALPIIGHVVLSQIKATRRVFLGMR